MMKRPRRRQATTDLQVHFEGGELGSNGDLSPAAKRFLDYLIDRAIEEYVRRDGGAVRPTPDVGDASEPEAT